MSVASINLGRVRGNMWYIGTAITGSSTTPTAFETGISEAAVGDLYLNSDNSNVFQCTLSGDETTALWVWAANIRGSDASVIDNLESDSTTTALSARMGGVLKEALEDSKVYPTYVDISSNETGYALTVSIENVSTTITIETYSGDEITYDFTPTTTDLLTEVVITIDTDTGFSTTGAILSKVSVSAGFITAVSITGSDDTVYTFEPDIWDELEKIESNVQTGVLISDGSSSYRTTQITKRINNTRTNMYPLTHAKATWYSIANNKTMYDIINDLNASIGAFATHCAGTHNSLFRGTQLDSLDYEKIADGTFEGMYIGDYVVINDNTYTIAAFDSMLNAQNTEHHVMLVTDVMYDAQYNESDDTTTGYALSTLFTNDLETAIETLETDFEDYLYSHYEYVTADAGADWYAMSARPLSETQVFGRPIYDTSVEGQATDRYLPLFRLNPNALISTEEYWLYNIASDTEWAVVTTEGLCSKEPATTTCGVKLYFLVKGE